MRISYLRLLPIIFTFQIVVGQKESIPSNWGIHVGYATQQAFPFKNKDYTLTQNNILVCLRLQQFQLGNFKVDVLSELGYYFSKHQLRNKWFTTTSNFDDFPENFQEKMMVEKNIHQLATHLGITLNWFLSSKIAVFGYGSVGPMWTSQETERLAAGFAFSDNIGLGMKLKYKKNFWISSVLILRHESNANLKFPNSGHNSVGLRLGVMFISQKIFKKK
tara:strand:- start:16 stop:672 length:657 start_codon:yes stop_codon:yes gene_type:complete